MQTSWQDFKFWTDISTLTNSLLDQESPLQMFKLSPSFKGLSDSWLMKSKELIYLTFLDGSMRWLHWNLTEIISEDPETANMPSQLYKSTSPITTHINTHIRSKRNNNSNRRKKRRLKRNPRRKPQSQPKMMMTKKKRNPRRRRPTHWIYFHPAHLTLTIGNADSRQPKMRLQWDRNGIGSGRTSMTKDGQHGKYFTKRTQMKEKCWSRPTTQWRDSSRELTLTSESTLLEFTECMVRSLILKSEEHGCGEVLTFPRRWRTTHPLNTISSTRSIRPTKKAESSLRNIGSTKMRMSQLSRDSR